MNEMELLKAAAEETVYSNVYYGKCLLTVWEGKFPRNEEGRVTGAPIRWVEGDSPRDKIVMIDFLLDLVPGCTANYPVKQSFKKFDKDYQRIFLPSIKEIGAVDPAGNADLAQIKDHYVKVQQVEGTRPRDKNDPEKGNWNTWKILAVYKSQDDCMAAMALDNGEEDIPGIPASSAPKNDSRQDDRRKAALEFCRVAIGMYKGMKEAEIRKAIGQFIDSNPNVNPYVKVTDPEIGEMINEMTIPFD